MMVSAHLAPMTIMMHDNGDDDIALLRICHLVSLTCESRFANGRVVVRSFPLAMLT